MKKLLSLFVLIAICGVASAQVSISITTTNVSCNSNCDGVATATPTGGTPPYTYLWAPTAFTTATANALCVGNYTVTVTDQLGGTATATCVIGGPSAISVTAVANPSSVCAGNPVGFSLTVLGGNPPYTFSWSFPGGTPSSSNVQNPTTTYYNAGMYNATCSVVDANGCSSNVTIGVNVSGGPNITISEIPTSCNQATGTLTASGATSYNWTPGNITSATVTGVASNVTYTCTGVDFMGCIGSTTIVTTDSCNYVWPGDANDDAVADNLDILAIGVLNGATGSTRPSASTTWTGQWSAEWLQFQSNGSDYKYADCDGNGTIDAADTNAVVQNYGMIHNNRLGSPVYSASGPDISLMLWQDTIPASGMTGINVHLGSATNPANNVYGFAFRLNYDAAEISTPTINWFGTSTWFGNPGTDQMRVVLHPNPAMGYVDVAVVRLDQQDVSGQGYIGTLRFIATSNQVGSGNFQQVQFTLSNVVLISSTGTQLPVNSVTGDTLEVCDPPLIMSVPSSSAPEISVYPNPANDALMLQIASGQQIVTIEDLSGRIVYSQSHNAGVVSIATSEFNSGMYIVRVADDAGNSSAKKITIAH